MKLKPPPLFARHNGKLPQVYPTSLEPKPAATIHTRSAMLLVGTVAAVFLADVPVANYFHAHPLPANIVEMHNVAEVFGHGLGVILVVAILLALDPARRWIVPRLAFAAWGGGMAANLVKTCVTRPRPHAFDATGLVNSLTSFGHTIPGVTDHSVLQSFPSAHVATATGLAVVLSRLYPHGRWLFFMLVLTVASQRISGNSHFVSDCLAGALLGWSAGQVSFQERWASRWFDRLEFLLGRPRPDEAAASADSAASRDALKRAA
ncbi:MAG: phosphatase PAP2 family protein [Planctomycetales bacterium]|nr:phosphatase PAP2 family protein [Planctomycetales bacterium]